MSATSRCRRHALDLAQEASLFYVPSFAYSYSSAQEEGNKHLPGSPSWFAQPALPGPHACIQTAGCRQAGWLWALRPLVPAGNVGSPQEHMQLVLEHVQHAHPWWNRTQGRDHFLVGRPAGTQAACRGALPAACLHRPGRRPGCRCSPPGRPLTAVPPGPGLSLQWLPGDLGACFVGGIAQQPIKVVHWGGHSTRDNHPPMGHLGHPGEALGLPAGGGGLTRCRIDPPGPAGGGGGEAVGLDRLAGVLASQVCMRSKRFSRLLRGRRGGRVSDEHLSTRSLRPPICLQSTAACTRCGTW